MRGKAHLCKKSYCLTAGGGASLLGTQSTPLAAYTHRMSCVPGIQELPWEERASMYQQEPGPRESRRMGCKWSRQSQTRRYGCFPHKRGV